MVTGIITDGGTKCNIIPERASLEIGMRAQTNAELRQIETRVFAIIKSAAEATGCQVFVPCTGCISNIYNIS